MRTPRHKKPSATDLERLGEAHRILTGLMARLSPVTDEYRSLVNAADAVRTTAIDWTRNPNIWHGSASTGIGAGVSPTFLTLDGKDVVSD